MINILKQENGKISEISKYERNCWINLTDPNDDEIERLKKEFHVPSEFIEDILDIDERSRLETERRWMMILIRIPVFVPKTDFSFYTVPLGILLSQNLMITICDKENEIVKDIIQGMIKGIDINNRQHFILNIFNLTSSYYMRFLKVIVRSTNQIEKDIRKSIENSQLDVLIKVQKCLVYFTTSIRNNEILLEKLRKSKHVNTAMLDEEFLEDIQIENKQAYEMAKIHSEILTGMMDAFASIISNNMSVVMKRLTIITVIFMPLNIIAGMGGMSEFSAMTLGIPWVISYGLFTVGIGLIGWITYLMIKRIGFNK